MAATLTPEQRKTIAALAAAPEGLFCYDMGGMEEELQALEAMGLLTYRSTTRYYWFSNGEPGEDDGYLAVITDRGRRSAELARQASLV